MKKEPKPGGVHICIECGREVFGSDAEFIRTQRKTEICICKDCVEKIRRRR